MLYPVCSLLVCRVSTGSTRFPTAELVGPAGCSQGVRKHNLHSLLPRHNLRLFPLQISLVQISIHLDNRDRRLGREGQHLILQLRRSRNLPLARIHTLLNGQLLRWRPLGPSTPPRATHRTNSLAPARLIPLVRARRLAMATRPIQHPVHLQLPRHRRLYPLSTSY